MLPLFRGPLPPPERERGDNSDAARRLARRFARVVTLHHRQRHQVTAGVGSDKHHRRRRRNCASQRRQVARARRSEIEREPEPEDSTLDDSIRSLQAHISSLERSTLLRESAALLWRANSSVVALDLTREYFQQFARGYDSENVERSAITNSFMASVFRDDILCRDFQGLQPFMDQWEKYTTFHQGLAVELQSLRVAGNDDSEDSRCAVTVYASSEIRVTFTEDTLKFLYPALFAQAQEDPQARGVVRTLVGSRAALPMELVLNFDAQGRVFAFESRVNLVEALLTVLRSPSAAICVHQSSIMTTDGHWQTSQDAGEVARRERLLPRQLL